MKQDVMTKLITCAMTWLEGIRPTSRLHWLYSTTGVLFGIVITLVWLHYAERLILLP